MRATCDLIKNKCYRCFEQSALNGWLLIKRPGSGVPILLTIIELLVALRGLMRYECI